MDLSDSSIRSSDTAEITIKNPKDGQPTDIVIEVLGGDSGKYKKAFRDYRKKAVEEAKPHGKDGLPVERSDELMGEFVSNITVDWKGVAWEGKPLKCTEANKRKVFCDPSLFWLTEQVDRFTSDRRNFLGN